MTNTMDDSRRRSARNAVHVGQGIDAPVLRAARHLRAHHTSGHFCSVATRLVAITAITVGVHGGIFLHFVGLRVFLGLLIALEEREHGATSGSATSQRSALSYDITRVVTQLTNQQRMLPRHPTQCTNTWTNSTGTRVACEFDGVLTSVRRDFERSVNPMRATEAMGGFLPRGSRR